MQNIYKQLEQSGDNIDLLALPPRVPLTKGQSRRQAFANSKANSANEITVEGSNFAQAEPMCVVTQVDVCSAQSNVATEDAFNSTAGQGFLNIQSITPRKPNHAAQATSQSSQSSARSTSTRWNSSTNTRTRTQIDFKIRHSPRPTPRKQEALEESKVEVRSNSAQKLRDRTRQAQKIEVSRPKVHPKIDVEVKEPTKYSSGIERWIYKNIMIPYKIPSVQVVFAHNDDIVYDQAFGYADVVEKRKADNANFNRIASVSKAVTRACLEALVERKLLKTSQKVFKEFLTEYNISRNPRLGEITVQHLIDHEVGLWGTVGNGEDPMFWYAHQYSQAEVIQMTINHSKWKLEWSPGYYYLYSNFGYTLLGRVIEKVTKKAYIDFVREEFNVDARLGEKTYDLLLPNENTYYSTYMGEVYGMHLARMDAAAGIIINPRDLVKLAIQADNCDQQRGSIPGAETQLTRWGKYTMAAFCNRRKGYLNIIPLQDLFDHLTTVFGKDKYNF